MILETEDFLILPCDLREVRKGDKTGFCRPGLERWASHRGLSLKHFMKNGVRASLIMSFDDPYTKQVIEAAQRRIELERGLANGDAQ